MTYVLYDPVNYRMQIKGHANVSQDGRDPVCAGCSALAWALVEASTEQVEYHARLYIDEKKPVIDVCCRPEPDAEKACLYMFEVIMGGLLLISEAHPENVRIRIGGPEDGA